VKTTALGEVLEPVRDPVRVDDPLDAKLISVRLHGKGAVRRVPGEGKAPKEFTGNRGRAGQFVFSRIWARRGAMALIPADLDGVVVTNEFPIFDINRERLDPNYLNYFVQTDRFIADLERVSAGASGQNRVKESAFLGLDIPLPPLVEQRRIAAILDRADRLRARRRQVLDHLDSLTQSIFVEMFGDPVSNPRNLPRAAIGSLTEVVTGGSPPRSQPENFGSEIEWIKSDNLGGDVATTAMESLSKVGMNKARVAPAGSVLVTCIAGSPNSIGKASIVDRSVSFNQQINAVLPSPTLDMVFLLAQLKTAPGLVRAKSSGGMKGLVSKSAFTSIEILNPSVADQARFSEVANVVRSRREKAASATNACEELLGSLQSRAFSGQL